MLKGRSHAVSELLSDTQTDTYEHPKTALLAWFSLHRTEVRLLAHEELNRRKFVEGRQSIANIVPVYKKGDKSNPANYRPISLTSIRWKTMEHILSYYLGSSEHI